MFGIFVNENGGVHYAQAIAQGYKPIETRSRNMLRQLVGERVAIIRTRRGKRPHIVGYATIANAYFCPVYEFNRFRDLTLIPPGSAYDCHGKGKWFYEMVDAEPCEPFPLPEDATYHGRSWCEYGERTEYVTWTTMASFCKP